MLSNQSVRVKRRRKSSVSPVFFALFATALFSAAVAAIWQNATAVTDAAVQPSDPIFALSNTSSAAPVADVTAVSPSSDILPSGPEAMPAAVFTKGEQVPETERVGSSYFDDAAFVGDSITTGIKLYDVMSNADVFAGTGISLANIFTNEAVKDGEEKMTILQALQKSRPKKIYIMIGANSLGSSVDWALEQYAKLIDQIKAQHPQSILYIQSVLPLYEPTFKQKYNTNISNAVISTFNQELKSLVREKELYFLDVASVFLDETGSMPSAYTPDGLHINSAQYVMWFDYLKEHAVPVK